MMISRKSIVATLAVICLASAGNSHAIAMYMADATADAAIFSLSSYLSITNPTLDSSDVSADSAPPEAGGSGAGTSVSANPSAGTLFANANASGTLDNPPGSVTSSASASASLDISYMPLNALSEIEVLILYAPMVNVTTNVTEPGEIASAGASAFGSVFSGDTLVASLTFGLNRIMLPFGETYTVRVGASAAGRALAERAVAVPEPGSLVLLGSGLLGLVYLRRRRASI